MAVANNRAYLVKPFSTKGLLSALNVALEWVEDAKAKGAKADDVGDKLSDCLDSLKDLQHEVSSDFTADFVPSSLSMYGYLLVGFAKRASSIGAPGFTSTTV